MCLPPIDQDPTPYFRLLKELALNNITTIEILAKRILINNLRVSNII